jgi:hypothetical protein
VPWCERCFTVLPKTALRPSFFKDESICRVCEDGESTWKFKISKAAGKNSGIEMAKWEGKGRLPNKEDLDDIQGRRTNP